MVELGFEPRHPGSRAYFHDHDGVDRTHLRSPLSLLACLVPAQSTPSLRRSACPSLSSVVQEGPAGQGRRTLLFPLHDVDMGQGHPSTAGRGHLGPSRLAHVTRGPHLGTRTWLLGFVVRRLCGLGRVFLPLCCSSLKEAIQNYKEEESQM